MRLLFFIFYFFIISSNSYAAKVEKVFGLGGAFYTGKDSQSVMAPPFGISLSFAANYIGSQTINVINRFSFDLAVMGLDFAGSEGAYNALGGNYNFAFKFNFVTRETLKPYIEFGPLLGFFVAVVPGSESISQVAVKPGGSIGTGFDWLKEPKRGEGSGKGISVNYFRYFQSASVLDFTSGRMTITGIKLEFRFMLAPSM